MGKGGQSARAPLFLFPCLCYSLPMDNDRLHITARTILKAAGTSLPMLFSLLAILSVPAITHANDPVLENNYAVELLKNKEYEKALDHFLVAYRTYPNDQTIKKNLAFAYLMTGERFMERGRFEEAAEQFDHAKELLPDEPKHWLLRGIALERLNDYDNARYEIERARALGGDTPEVLYHLGRVFYASGETARGVELWEQALMLDPNNKELRALLEKSRRELAVESAMDKGHGGKFLVSYDAAVSRDLADRFLDTLENIYNSVGYDLGRYPAAKAPVILYSRKDYKNITDTPEWSGGVYDGKIRLPIGGVTEITPRIRATLRHEYTHVVIYDMTRGNCPTWLNEGLAEVEGRMEHNPPIVELGRAFKNNALLSFRTLEGEFFSLGRKEALLAYEQSYAMANFMVKSYGWHKVQEILLNLGKGMDMEAAVGAALGDYGLDYKKLQEEWLAYVAKEFGAN